MTVPPTAEDLGQQPQFISETKVWWNSLLNAYTTGLRAVSLGTPPKDAEGVCLPDTGEARPGSRAGGHQAVENEEWRPAAHKVPHDDK